MSSLSSSSGAPVSTSASNSITIGGVQGDLLEVGRAPQGEPDEIKIEDLEHKFENEHKKLFWWNFSGAIAHGVQAIIMVAVSHKCDPN